MNYARCGDCAFSASFVKECTDVSYVAEGVELTLHKESVAVEEIKEVELRSRREQIFIYDKNHNRNTVIHEEVKTSCYSKEKSKGICTQGYLGKYHFLLFFRIHN